MPNHSHHKLLLLERSSRYLMPSLPPAQWTRKTSAIQFRQYASSIIGLTLFVDTRYYSSYTVASVWSGPIVPYPPLHPLCQSRLLNFRSPFFLTNMALSNNTQVKATHSSLDDSSSSSSSSTKTVRVVIKGRVQGVFYRNWTIENANQLGLKGWVRNRRDGSVEALFSGDSDKVQEMEQRCRRGPPDAIVTGLQVFPSEEDPGTGFGRKPTV